MTDRHKAILILVVSSLFWSSAGLSKILIQEFDPFFTGLLRFFIGSVIILPFFLKEKFTIQKFKQSLPVTIVGAINVVLYFLGLQTSTATAAVLIYGAVPLLTAVFAKILLHEQITRNKIIGFLIGLAGVSYITFLPAWEKGEAATGAFPGNYFFLVAIFAWSLYMTGSRYLLNTKQYSPISVTGISLFTNCFVFLILSLFTFDPAYLPALTKPTNILLIFHIGILVSVVPFLMLQWALTKISASTGALTNYLQPVFGIFINALVLQESVSLHLALGGILIFAGVAIASGILSLKRKR